MDVAGEFACFFESGAKPILLNVHMVGVKVNDEIIYTHHSEIFAGIFTGVAEVGFVTVYWLDSERHSFWFSIVSRLRQNVGHLLLFVIGRRMPWTTLPT